MLSMLVSAVSPDGFQILEEHKLQGEEDQALEKRAESKKAAAKKRATRKKCRFPLVPTLLVSLRISSESQEGGGDTR